MRRRIRLLVALCTTATGIPDAVAQHQRVNWVHLEQVALVENDANDGDSFHARRRRSNYRLRLYFVDCPEADSRFPDRLQEQADYFGVSMAQVLEGGEMASAFSRELLGKDAFDVHTKYRDALGAGGTRRIYAIVEVNGRRLCERLVEAGLARIHGTGDDLPDGTPERRHWSRLRTLESAARRDRRGLWGMNTPEQRIARTDGRVVLSRRTPVLRLEAPHDLVGHLPEGHEVRAGVIERPGIRRVTFTSPGGNEFTGLIQESFLENAR